MQEQEHRKLTRWNAVAGAALGLLVGFLLGLSSAPVVASVLAAIIAGGMVFLSLTNIAGTTAASSITNTTLIRITSFSLLALIGVILGIFLRTQSFLGPTELQRQYQELVAIGVTEEAARAAVLTRYNDDGLEDANRDAVLFTSTTEQCEELRPDRYSTSQAAAAAFISAGGAWKKAAESSSRLPSDQQLGVLRAVHEAAC